MAAPLSVERIVEEAIALVDAEGAAALSMRRLAARLGTSTMATYHHVPDKQALVEAIAERVMRDLADPDPSVPWPDAVRTMAASFRGLTLAHPAVFQVLLSGPRPAALMRTAEGVVHRLVAAGFPAEDAVLTFRTFIRFLIGSAMLEADTPMDSTARDRTFAYGLDAIIAGVALSPPTGSVAPNPSDPSASVPQNRGSVGVQK